MDTKQLVKVFKALSNENRLEIYFQIVKSNEKCFDANYGCFINDVIEKLNAGFIINMPGNYIVMYGARSKED